MTSSGLVLLCPCLLELLDLPESGEDEVILPDPDALALDFALLEAHLNPALRVALFGELADERLLGRENRVRAQERRMGRVKCGSQAMGYESALRICGGHEALDVLIISRESAYDIYALDQARKKHKT